MKRYLFVIWGENKHNLIKDIKHIYGYFPGRVNNITEIMPPPITSTCDYDYTSCRVLLLKDVYIPNGNYIPIYLNSSYYKSSDSVLDIILKNDEMLKHYYQYHDRPIIIS